MDPSKVLSDVIQSTIGAKTHFDMWWAQANEARLEMPKALDGHDDYFAATYDAHYTAFFVYIAHLFDARTDSSSIPRYFQLMGSQKDKPWNVELEDAFAKLAARARPLLVARHKTIAHIDARLTEKEVFGPLQVTWNEIRAILEEIVSFVVRLGGATSAGELGIPGDGRMKESMFLLLEQLHRGRSEA